jgi:hypothetical protein
MIVSADRTRRTELLSSWSDADVIVNATPLDVLGSLERYGPAISTVVLSDVVGSATYTELAEFLEEHYPFVRVISARALEPADGDRHSIAAREAHASCH